MLMRWQRKEILPGEAIALARFGYLLYLWCAIAWMLQGIGGAARQPARVIAQFHCTPVTLWKMLTIRDLAKWLQ